MDHVVMRQHRQSSQIIRKEKLMYLVGSAWGHVVCGPPTNTIEPNFEGKMPPLLLQTQQNPPDLRRWSNSI